MKLFGLLSLLATAPALAGTPHYLGICQNSCKVSSPIPDVLTLRVIRNFDHFLAWDNFKPGDTLTICNAQFCTTYDIINGLNGLDYINGKTERQQDHPATGGSHTGHGGGSGGRPGTGPSIAPLRPDSGLINPTVTVGGGTIYVRPPFRPR